MLASDVAALGAYAYGAWQVLGRLYKYKAQRTKRGDDAALMMAS
jgi:hypothetical protein